MGKLIEGQISVNKGKYYRVTMGRKSEGGKTVPASLSLGTDYAGAKIRRDAMDEVWRFPMRDGEWVGDVLVWTPVMLARVERFVVQR